MTLSRSPQCRALTDEKSLSPLFPVGGGQWIQMNGALLKVNQSHSSCICLSSCVK